MIKSELVPGKHIVETRNGDKFLVLVAKDVKIFGTSLDGKTYIDLTKRYYGEDLKSNKKSLRDLDVVKVYEIISPTTLEGLILDLAWESPEEPKEMTMKELEEELGYPVKIVKEK